MSGVRLHAPTALAAVAALAVTLLAAPPATAADDGELSVVELDLSGIAARVLPELPSPESVPVAEDAVEPTPADATASPAGTSAAGAVVRTAVARTGVTPAPQPTAPAEAAVPEPTPSPAVEPTAPAARPTAPAADPSTPAEASGAEEAPADPDVLTSELDTAPFSVMGATWDATDDVEGVVIRYRVRTAGTWSDWEGVGSSDVAPDTGSEDAGDGSRDGTDPIVAVDADGVQVWAEAERGHVTGLTLVLVDPGADPAAVGATVDADEAVADAAQVRTAAARVAAVPPAAPAIISRAGWGADESLRTCSPDYSNDMVSAAVHHTASSNGYSAEAVPGLIRGFYAYHTRPEAAGGRGWCDIGYNFLVDQFGRVFEGRAGGIGSTVVGVHTGGFNSRTIGIAAIGEYSAAAPSAALLESLSQLIAWKFSIHRILAGGSVQMVSGGGASKYPAGTVVQFPTIYAHRDAQLTSCPGNNLYNALPSIRARVAQLGDASVAASPRGRVDGYAGTTAGVRVSGWAFDPESAASLTIDVAVDGAVQTLVADQSRPDVAAAYGVGDRHGFSGVVSATNGSHIVCVTARNVGTGGSVLLGCQWVTVTNPPPIGYLERVDATATSVTATGWTLDPDTTAPISVHVYVDGVASGAFTADGSRPDVAAVHGKGDRHGFSVTVPATGGSHRVCVYAINTPAGANTLLGCQSTTVGKPPFGYVDSLTTTPAGFTVGGWAIDPDTRDPVAVHIYVDGRGAAAVTASASRPDVGRAHGMGDAHGFSVTLPAASGAHQVCAFAINTPSGPNTPLGCTTAVVQNATPIGNLEAASASPSGISVSGWASDADTADPIAVHVYVDGRGVGAVSAGIDRPDVGRHGYAATVAAADGPHQVCTYAINTPAGPNRLLGCATVTVRNAAPIGNVERVAATASGIAVAGWTSDPDTTAPIGVHVYVDGVAAAVWTSDAPRPDVGRHGFSGTIAAARGAHQVCVYAINSPAGANPRLACANVTL
jgi:hypothetical protein